MYKYNFALFCKSFRGDFERARTLKESIDTFNADALPFVMVVPESDYQMFSALRHGHEKYDFILMTDEQVLQENGIQIPQGGVKQSWSAQQIIKMGFYKTNLARFYAIYDSDAYFIANFHMSDYMYNDDVPYIIYNDALSSTMAHRQFRATEYFGRRGKPYDFVHLSQVFSSNVLRHMADNLLAPQQMTFVDLIKIHPYEFDWYGEYVMHIDAYPIKLSMGRLKQYFYNEEYRADRRRGIRVSDLVKMGYNAIGMQRGWVAHAQYRNPWYGKFARTRRAVYNKIHSSHKRDPLRLLILVLWRIPTWTIREFIRA
ncbi:MAG: hypothetical protein IJD69_02560 [Alphaproteobacteria bacterium]|nr:hypothetical protein [Alphaproteobacteria bacterium]